MTKINYIRPDAQLVPHQPYQGQRYQDLAPFTLDVSERAALAVNGLTGPTDPEWDYELYFWAYFFFVPPILIHDNSDWCQCKFMEALPLMRLITGSPLNQDVDRVWREAILKSIGPDGLFYLPLENRPWLRINTGNPVNWVVWRAGGARTVFTDPSVAQFTHPFVCGRIIGAMTLHYLHDRDPIWKDAIERMILRLSELAVHAEDYAYFPEGVFEPNARIDGQTSQPKMEEDGGGRLIQGLAQYYRATGFEPARELAAQLARGFVDHGTYYDRQGHFMLYDGQGQPAIDAEGRPVYGGHFHAHSIGLLSVLEYALAAHDNRMLAFVQKSFEWARLQGSPLVGYFPEQINNVLEFVIPPYWDTVEICEVADMIGLAVKLSAAGAGDYWDDVDRWARNHFFECQLTKSDWVYRIPRKNNSTPVEPNQSTNRVAERNIGAFSGFASGSDWGVRMGIMHCCTGNAVRAIYYIWENILQEKAGALALNLLLNRAAPQADVYSHLPYQGRVDIKAKQPFSNVLVRAPEWIASGSEQVKVKVNNQAVTSGWRGRYISAGPVNAGDTVTVIFPIRERVLKERLGDTIYTLIIKGNTVVAIDPPGQYCPIYQRDHYRQDHVLWHTVDRFVCDETVEW